MSASDTKGRRLVRRMVQITVIVLGILVSIGALLAVVNRPLRVEISAPLPADFPEDRFRHDDFEKLLAEYVDADGNVDYERWKHSPDAVASLDRYLAAVSAYSPDNAPERFPNRGDELAYWIYGYNAYVVRTVLDNWPVTSVTDIKAPIEAVKGLGFFYRLRFVFGGRAYSLLAVENTEIRKRYRDARIHFVLSCASESCPVMRPQLPDGDDLEILLASAAADFVSDRDNVEIDHAAKKIYLSRIFKWYRKDFLNDLARQGRPAEQGLIDYVASVAPAGLRAELERARDYPVQFRDYDWTINAGR